MDKKNGWIEKHRWITNRWMVGCIENKDGWLDVQKKRDGWVLTCDTCSCSAASNWKPGPHAVSTIIQCIQSTGCC